MSEHWLDVPAGRPAGVGSRDAGGVGVDVGHGAGPDLGARDGVVVGGAVRLDDELAHQAVAPVVDAVDVVVEEDVVELDVRVPAVLDELGAGPLAGRVGVGEWRVERSGSLVASVDRR